MPKVSLQAKGVFILNISCVLRIKGKILAKESNIIAALPT
jgi:hypothetical protein